MIHIHRWRESFGFTLFWFFVGSGAINASVSAAEPTSDPAMQLFEERIMPIFNSPNPSSCVQCHLSSVDIKDYILPSHTDTFVALREQGLVDPQNPQASKILKLIQMGDKDADRGAKRIHEKTRRAEYDAFASWIKACCEDQELVSKTVPRKGRPVGPQRPIEVVRHARKSRIVESFTQKVWSQRMRCFPCHTPNEIDTDNPQHTKPAERHRDFVKTYGAKMNLFRESPEATLAALVASSRKQDEDRYPLINLSEPSKSLLILKPTAKLPPKDATGKMAKPSSADPVTHMGGLKMHVDDHSYKMWVAWLEDYAAVVGDRYRTAAELPGDNWIPTQRILRLKDAPPKWGVGTVVQLFVHQKGEGSEQWSKQPVAFTQGTVTPRGMVNGALLIVASNLNHSDDPNQDAFPLSPGEYLVQAYVDSDRKVSQSPSLLLGPADYVGRTTIEAKWEIGFPKAETFLGGDLQK
jgi:hypothetical protein